MNFHIAEENAAFIIISIVRKIASVGSSREG